MLTRAPRARLRVRRRRDVLLRRRPNVVVRLGTQVVGGHGDTRLESLVLQEGQGRREEVPAAAVFIMIGAEPGTEWLAPAISLDQRGFVLTGRDLPSTAWPLAREPYPFETSRPGSSQPATYATAPSNGLPVLSAKDPSQWDPSIATWPSPHLLLRRSCPGACEGVAPLASYRAGPVMTHQLGAPA